MLEGMIVPAEGFPRLRKTSCCPKKALAGESVVVLRYNEAGLDRHMIMHARCLRELLGDLPLDARDYLSLFDTIKNNVRATGNAFASYEERQNGAPKVIV